MNYLTALWHLFSHRWLAGVQRGCMCSGTCWVTTQQLKGQLASWNQRGSITSRASSAIVQAFSPLVTKLFAAQAHLTFSCIHPASLSGGSFSCQYEHTHIWPFIHYQALGLSSLTKSIPPTPQYTEPQCLVCWERGILPLWFKIQLPPTQCSPSPRNN